MKIKEHRLVDVETSSTPFQNGKLEPIFLLMHYSAGGSYKGSLSWWQNKDARASAHVLIGRNGETTQVVAFNRRAWHAGESRVKFEGKDYRYLNKIAIGVELANWGPLRKVGDSFISWAGALVDPAWIIEARHKNELSTRYWEAYRPKQIERAVEVCAAIMRKYELRGVLGHDDVSPGRKTDPGPAFEMKSFAAKISGRSNLANAIDEAGFIDIDLHIHNGVATNASVARLVYNPETNTRKLYTK